MNLLQKISPEWALRLGLGSMFLYSGIHMFQYPRSWTWAIPGWYGNIAFKLMSVENYFKLQGASEVILALLLLAWFLKPSVSKWIALFAAVEVAGILFLGKTGLDPVTFRDLSALGAAIALWLILDAKSKLSTGAPSARVV